MIVEAQLFLVANVKSPLWLSKGKCSWDPAHNAMPATLWRHRHPYGLL
jgi:hypothetical protein